MSKIKIKSKAEQELEKALERIGKATKDKDKLQHVKLKKKGKK